MGYGSGLGAQFGVAAESTVGTIVTPTRFYELNSESLELSPTALQGTGLRAGLGSRYPRSSRRVRTTKTAGGSVAMDLPTSGLGLLLKHMIGSPATAVQQGGTAAYKQDHRPGSLTGFGLTLQKGVPQTDGTSKPFTYAGSKVIDWEIACQVGEIGTLALNFDSWNETTATTLATASYAASASVFHFAQGTVKLGGTPSTTANVTSIAGGTTVASITSAAVRGTNALKTDRFYYGSAGIKAEQLENDWGSVSGSLEGEFVNQATIYDVWNADTSTSLELTFVGANISGIYNYTLDIVIPYIRWDGESPKVDGPDVVDFSAAFTGLDNSTDNTVQLSYTSTDTAP